MGAPPCPRFARGNQSDVASVASSLQRGSGILLVLNEQKIKKKALSPWELVEVAGSSARA